MLLTRGVNQSAIISNSSRVSFRKLRSSKWQLAEHNGTNFTLHSPHIERHHSEASLGTVWNWQRLFLA